nr:MAG: hypothetical protein DIU61_12920 [Bacteroidota bacterium]
MPDTHRDNRSRCEKILQANETFTTQPASRRNIARKLYRNASLNDNIRSFTRTACAACSLIDSKKSAKAAEFSRFFYSCNASDHMMISKNFSSLMNVDDRSTSLHHQRAQYFNTIANVTYLSKNIHAMCVI